MISLKSGDFNTVNADLESFRPTPRQETELMVMQSLFILSFEDNATHEH